MISQTNRQEEKIVSEFQKSEGNFELFYLEMNEEERIIFKEYLHKLRVQEHSPLIREREPGEDSFTSPLF